MSISIVGRAIGKFHTRNIYRLLQAIQKRVMPGFDIVHSVLFARSLVRKFYGWWIEHHNRSFLLDRQFTLFYRLDLAVLTRDR